MKKIVFAALLSGASVLAAPSVASAATTPLTVSYVGSITGNNGNAFSGPVVFTGETTLEDANDGSFGFSNFTALFNAVTYTIDNASASFSGNGLDLFSGSTKITSFGFTGNTNFAADGTPYSVALASGSTFQVAGLGDVSFTGGAGAVSGSTGSLVGAVPEPATWAMMLIGFGMMGGTMRYRRRNTTIAYA